MAMELDTTDLEEIKQKLEVIDKAGLEVTQIKHKDHYIWLRRGNGGDGPRHLIVGISKDQRMDGKAFRG